MRVVRIAKDFKHAQMVLLKRYRTGQLHDLAFGALDRLLPWSYMPSAMSPSFVTRVPKAVAGELPPAPSRVFMLWTGDNPISENRAVALAEARVRFDLVLITPANLHEWVLVDRPLHPAYEHLSLVHRSDYLRAYLMRYHGGIYLDVKRGWGDVLAAVEMLNASPSMWLTGYRERSSRTVAADNEQTLRVLRRRHRNVIGMNGFAARPGSPIVVEWLDEVHALMNAYAGQLEQHPGDVFGENADYPVPWTKILGDVLHPICLKYSDRLMLDESFRPSEGDYR